MGGETAGVEAPHPGGMEGGVVGVGGGEGAGGREGRISNGEFRV